MNFIVTDTRVPLKCDVCDIMQPIRIKIIQYLDNRNRLVVICGKCAYGIHSAYEGSM